jgi:polyhydroxyalkanoate synthase
MNLVRGLKNLIDDLERGQGELLVKMTNLSSFEVGRNIAKSPGKVIYQNDLIQLIQYSPSTEKVNKRPLLFVPPWINKYYILDLSEGNSMVKWMVDEGHTVFMISWVNPDERHKEIEFEDYMFKGPIAALDVVEKVTGEEKVNAVGFCMGGTLLACTLAYLAATGQDRIASATYMASLMNFDNPGEIGAFLDAERIDGYEKEMEDLGYMKGRDLAIGFNMLRPNELIWNYVVDNYLKGEEPIPFELLYWNSDSTNLPARMHLFYLKNMYLYNRLCKPGGITLGGVPIDLSAIDVPVYFISTEKDHICLWDSTYQGARLHSGDVRFVLGGSGHIAGIVNPPTKNKYAYWTNEVIADSPEEWKNGATENKGSWWVDWKEWIAPHRGEPVDPRRPEDGPLPVIDDAPGDYVKKRLDVLEIAA